MSEMRQYDSTTVPLTAGLMLQSLPSPVVAIGRDGDVIEANAAAEEFFSTSRTALGRMSLEDLAPFSSPLFSALDRLRNTGTTLAEYGIKIGTPRTGGERTVDILAGVVPEQPGSVVVVILERSVAQAFDRLQESLLAGIDIIDPIRLQLIGRSAGRLGKRFSFGRCELGSRTGTRHQHQPADQQGGRQVPTILIEGHYLSERA